MTLKRPTSLHRLLFAIAFLLVAATAGCGGGGGGGNASVSIDSVDPQSTYPGVETTVSFSISPKAGVSKSDLEWRVNFGDGTTKKGEGAKGEASHEWEKSGQFTIEVVARANGSRVGEATRPIKVLSPVDLTVANIEPSPRNVGVDEDFKAIFDIENRSPTPVETSFDVTVMLTDQASVTKDELSNLTEIGSGTVQAPEDAPVVEGGDTRRVEVTVRAPEDTPGGDYHLVPWIKPEDQFADDNPDDNFAASQSIVRIENIQGVLPDVVVKDVYAIPERAFQALNDFQRGMTLENAGGGDAANVKTRTFLSIGDKKRDKNDIEVNTSGPVDIPSGEEKEIGPDQFVLNQDITPNNGKDRKVYVIVEAFMEGDSSESDESNNSAVSDPPITVSDKLVDGPDIVVDTFSVSPQKTFLDGPLEVKMKVTNQGKVDVGTFPCRLYAGEEARVNTNTDQPISTLSITSLKSKASKTIDRTVTIPGLVNPGTYHIYTVCDPNGALEETYRRNNQKIHPKAVEITDRANVDLYVDKITSPKTAQEGKEVELTASICVTGANASGLTKGELYQTTGTQVDFSKEPIQTFEIPNINPGKCKDVKLTYTADCEDFEETYAHGVVVDSTEKLPEKDEKNNKKAASQDLEIQGPFCKCTEDSFETNDKPRQAYTLSAGTTSAAVCDPGSCDFYGVSLKAKESLRVETTFQDDKGSLETKLFDPSGLSSLDSDSTPGRQRVGTFVVPNNGTYIFSVCGAKSSSRNLYDMDIDVISPQQGIDLIPRRIELPSRDTFSIGATIQADFRIHNVGTNSSGNFDVGLWISPDRKLGDGNDTPLKPATVSVNSITGSGNADVNAQVTIPTSLMKGSFYIGAKVDPTGQLTETDTTNNVTFSKEFDVKTRCYDPLEPNNGFSAAKSVKSGSFSNITVCATDDDYYKLCVADGKKFNIETTFNHKNGDVDLELYDSQKQVIDSSAQTGVDKEEVSVSYVNGAQCYFARAFVLTTNQSLQTTYNMKINVQNVPPSLQCSSHFEPNDSFSTASSFIAGVQQSGKLDRCPASDSDFYRVKLSQGQKVTFRGILDPASQPGSLRLQLYKPNQQPTKNVATAPGMPVAELKDYVAPISGTFFLQVTLSGNTRRVTYRLEESGLGGIDLAAEKLDFWPGTYKGGDSLNYDFELSNQRSSTAKTPTYTVYLGDGKTLDEQNDTKLQKVTHSDVSGNSTTRIVDSTTLPQSVPSGKRYIHVLVEADSAQTDPNTANNVATEVINLQ